MKNQPPSVAVVIPNWNGKEDLAACLDSLSHQTQKHTVVVVDNGSVDGSVEFIRTSHPNVELVALPKNTGFSGGVNAGILHALAMQVDYIALLNNDAVVDKKWLFILLETMSKKPEAAIITGKILKADKKHIDTTGEIYTTWGLPHPRGRDEIDTSKYENLEQVTSACAGSSLYRANVLQDIGLFDQRFFAYYEDVDISLRAQLLGWEVWYQPKAITYHKVGGTSSKLGDFTRYQSLKNYMLLYLGIMPGYVFWKHFPKYLFGVTWISLSNIKHGKFLVVIKAHGFVWLHLFPILFSRYKTMKKRTMASKEFESLLTRENPFLKRRRKA